MKVLVTGSSGFLGKYIIQEFERLQYSIDTIGRTGNVLIKADLSMEVPLFSKQYDLVVHAAGKAHTVPKTKAEKNEFYDVNLKGTKNLLYALKKPPKYFVFVSTVSVYGLDHGMDISELAPLKAVEPYGKSKIEAEVYLKKWCKENECKLTILRLPLVFGLNASGNLEKMVNAIKKGFFFNVGKGEARKSGVMADDVASFIPKIIIYGGTYNLTDGYAPSFKELSLAIQNKYNTRKIPSFPYYLVRILAFFGDLLEFIFSKKMSMSSRQFSKMTKTLTFSDDRARSKGWKPNKVLESQSQWLN